MKVNLNKILLIVFLGATFLFSYGESVAQANNNSNQELMTFCENKETGEYLYRNKDKFNFYTVSKALGNKTIIYDGNFFYNYEENTWIIDIDSTNKRKLAYPDTLDIYSTLMSCEDIPLNEIHFLRPDAKFISMEDAVKNIRKGLSIKTIPSKPASEFITQEDTTKNVKEENLDPIEEQILLDFNKESGLELTKSELIEMVGSEKYEGMKQMYEKMLKIGYGEIPLTKDSLEENPPSVNKLSSTGMNYLFAFALLIPMILVMLFKKRSN